MKRQTLLVFFLMVFSVSILNAQDNADTTRNYQTGEIDVIGLINGLKPIEIPQSVGVITSRDLSRTSGISLLPAINLIPGVRMEMRNTTSGTRIVIRGYGNQTNFNGIGYKAYYNEIPLTDADGTTIMDDIDFTTLSRVEVFKGPSSSIYGTGIAGVVKLTTDRAPFGTSIKQSVEAGRYGLLRTNTNLSYGTAHTNMFLNYGYQQYDGFRLHSASKRNYVTLNGSLYSDSKQSFNIFGQYTYSYDYLSGQVDSLGLYNYPDSSEAVYVTNDGHVNIESSMIGLSHSYNFSNMFSNTTSIFTEGFNQDQPSGAGLTRTNKVKYGIRTSFTLSPMLGAMKSRFIFGGEFLKNINYAKSYNLTSTGSLGTLRADQEVKPQQSNVFAEANVNLTKSTTFTVGASYNMINYDIADMRASTTTPLYVNATVNKKFDGVFTPRVAINQIINDNMSVYASVSRGYSPPSTGQVVITSLGTVNADLKPELATSYEVGTKGSLLKNRLSYELAGYWMDVTDKLVSQNFTSPVNYTATVNAGKVRYKGVELGLNYDMTPTRSSLFSLIRPFISYTYSNAENIEFRLNTSDTTAAGNLEGKKVSGVAPNLFNAGLDIDTKPGIYLNTTFMFVDIMPISFDNKKWAAPYKTLSAKLGLKRMLGKNYALDVFAGADNITGETYNQMIFINLTPQNAQTKYFNPAPPKVTYYGGVSLRYIFN